MRLSIGETSKLTGISVRTLHYYDEINLLKPSEVTESGYRYYDDNALEKLQQILFYRELDFPLKDIKEIISKPDYNSIQALKNHKELLLLKRKRLDKLIKLVENIIKGESTMEFNEFDMTEIEKAKEKYAKEVKEKWGDTKAYKENLEKTSKYKKEDWEKIQKEALKDGMRIPMMCIDLENGKKQFIVMLIDDLPPKAKTAVECDTEGLLEMHPFQISFRIKETKGHYANVVETSWGTFAIMDRQEYLHYFKEV